MDMLYEMAGVVFMAAFAGSVAGYYLTRGIDYLTGNASAVKRWERQAGSSCLTPLEQDVLRQLREWADRRRI